MIYNDIRNKKYGDLLYNYPLPPQTEKLSQATECFCPPNGGTCVLTFSEILLTSLSEEQIKAYYADIWFPPLRRQKAIPEEYQRTYVHLDFNITQHIIDLKQVKVSISEAFYDGGLDWRCTQL